MPKFALAALRVVSSHQWLEHLARPFDSLALFDSAMPRGDLQAWLAWLGQRHEHGLGPCSTVLAPQQRLAADLAVHLWPNLRDHE